MPTINSGLQIALQALLAQSQAIEVIEHNVANANTPGYRRQMAILSSSVPSPLYGMESGMGAGERGSGVTVDRIQRFNLDFFDDRFRTETGESKNWEMQSQVLTQMESTLSETTEDGLIPKLDSFWSGWQTLASDPTNTSLRANLLDEAGSMTNALNRRAQQLIQLRGDQDQAIGSRVNEINQTAAQIAKLNAEISRVLSVNEQPNDLLDKRDMLLDRLAEVAGATSTLQNNGEAIVSINGHVLVTGHDVIQLTTQPDPVNNNLLKVVWSDGQNFSPSSGELKGLFTVRDTSIPEQLNGLNQVAQALISKVNALHSSGFGLDGTTGLDFFKGSDALSIQVNNQVTTANLAVADKTGEPGNSVIASQISDLKLNKMMSGGTETINEFYTSQITNLGLTVQHATSDAQHQNLVVQSLGDQRESVGGVSLDEEAANLVQYQKAYQAAARVMTVFDDLLDRVINGMGKQ